LAPTRSHARAISNVAGFPRRYVSAVLGLVPLLLISTLVVTTAAARATDSSPCLVLGNAVAERVLLAPQPNTFYSVDVLNPDVIRWRGRFWMFFSGNSEQSERGDWRTGVAVSRSPLGPFGVFQGMAAPFLNGGTRVFGNTLAQVATPSDFSQPVMYRSRNLRSWRASAPMPAPRLGTWNALQSDPYYDPSGRVYFAGRPGPSGADIGSRSYLGNGRWGKARLELRRGTPGAWDGLDLGEPAIVRVRGQAYMLYAAQSVAGGPRQVGLASLTSNGWRRIGPSPLIRSGGAAWHSQNAIDPSPLVVGEKLYIYFGGGKTTSQGGNMNGTIGVRIYRLPRSGCTR
jgi:hypothetical protein